MKVVYHLGVHCTDEERLIRCLLRNRGPLSAEGIVVPTPGRYRKVLREALATLRGQPASRDTQELLLDTIMDEETAGRLVFSHEFFLGIPQRAVEAGRFYATAGPRCEALANLFPDDECEFHLGLCNPATLVPALAQRIEGAAVRDLLAGADPMTLRWPPVIAAIGEAVPDARIVVWCNEDTPLIWAEVLRALIDRPGFPPLEGEDDFMRTLLTEGGFHRYVTFMARRQPETPAERRALTADLLERYPRPGALTVDLGDTGWTEETVARMTEAYDADLEDIAGLPGVEIIEP